jgi:hypothetical protein
MLLLPKFGQHFPIPTRAMPKWLLILVGPMINKALNRKFIRNNIDIDWKASNSKIKKELNMTFLPLQTTMEDGFQVLVDEKIIQPKS